MFRLFNFGKKTVEEKQVPIVNKIVAVANGKREKDQTEIWPSLADKEGIVSDIIYDNRGARSLLGFDSALTDRVGQLCDINEDAAEKLKAEVMKQLSTSPTLGK